MKIKNITEELSQTFVATVDTSLAPQLTTDLKQQGFEITKPVHTIFQAKKKGVSCTFYISGKLTVQGKDKNDFIEFYLEPQILKTFSFKNTVYLLDKTPRIGIDESGKGDFFGPLCIAGVFAENELIDRLYEMGVKDSKLLTDGAILKIADKIKKTCPYHIVKINPEKYNELIAKFKNLNDLLAWGHATTIEHLSQKTTCTTIILDQFANESVVLNAIKRKNLNLNITQRHKAEADIVVAAASILARSAFVEGIASLEKQFNQELPKGASKKTIAAGKQFISTYGKELLHSVGKVHFKTLDSILEKT